MSEGAVRRELRIGNGADDTRPVLITGGAGFIGTNLAHRLMSAGTPVTVYDNLSRPGVERNLDWLRATHGPLLRFDRGDVRDAAALHRAVRGTSRVVHLAAQVAVTTSLVDPMHDFDVNARGTLNLLSALGEMSDPPPLLFTSTNKVYGGLGDVAMHFDGRRYLPEDLHLRASGIDECRSLDFHSPYGCSKGAADQYVLDYTRTFGLRAVVFRMSCIYGPHQFGTEDQGWVAHFLIRALRGEPITLYGDGQQVRDVLYVDDLVDAMLLAFENIDEVSGLPFNMGGGPLNTTSLLELIGLIGTMAGVEPEVRFDGWRPGDQRYYVSNTSRFTERTGWRASVELQDGVQRLYSWLQQSDVLAAPPASAPAAEGEWELAMGSPAAAAAGDR